LRWPGGVTFMVCGWLCDSALMRARFFFFSVFFLETSLDCRGYLDDFIDIMEEKASATTPAK
jgi:hypothetical protein